MTIVVLTLSAGDYFGAPSKILPPGATFGPDTCELILVSSLVWLLTRP